MNKGFGEKPGLTELMKKAQEMQKKMQEIQTQVAEMVETGVAGGGMIKIRVRGNHTVAGVEIDPSLLKEDKNIIEDLIAAAFNAANKKIEEETRKKMSSLTGIKLPDDFT